MKKCFTSTMAAGIFMAVFSCHVYGQNAGIGTSAPNPSAVLDISNTNKGLLIPRMSSATIATIQNPAKGLLVYDSVKNQLMVNTGNGINVNWQNLVANSGWGLSGNAVTNPVANFIGTTDNQPLLFKINNEWSGIIDSASANTRLGSRTGKNSFNTYGNTSFGAAALTQDINGSGRNTSLGMSALASNTTGINNTAIGFSALFENTTGEGNTANGSKALFSNTTGSFNTAIGKDALNQNISIYQGIANNYNTAIGIGSLNPNNGSYNTAWGSAYNGGSGGGGRGSGNTVGGIGAMPITNGSYNTVSGSNAMNYMYQGDYNSILGNNSLDTYFSLSQSAISQTTAVGYQTLYRTDGAVNPPAIDALGNTAFGYEAGSFSHNGAHNCFIGAAADITNGSVFNSIAMGHATTASVSNTMRVGNGATSSIGGPVKWSVVSDGRVKKNIHENIPGLSFIILLRPVTYTINTAAIASIEQGGATEKEKPTTDPLTPLMAAAYKAKEQIIYSGFLAQEVEQAAKTINYDFDGVDAPKAANDLYALRYESFIIPLVKSVQELAAQSDQLTNSSRSLKTEYQKITERLNALEKKIK